MVVRLTLLDGVRWDGADVTGARSAALLAALAAARGRTVPAGRLVEQIWGDEPPARAAKALQVVVSRTRASCGPDAVVHDGDGYRLGVAPDAVDSVRVAELVARARDALDRDAVAAADLACTALELAGKLELPAANGGAGPLSELRREASADRDAARRVRAQAASRTGAHADAWPALAALAGEQPDDESLLADLLRSEAAVRGTAPALERYERYRRDLRERIGASPGEALQRVHRDLLALDRPVRSGVHHDATSLLGRDEDLERLRALLGRARVVSIIGPGGIGKTRLAHVLARDATVPAVHVVELVGVTSPEDLVGEIGSVLGVRDSVGSRRTLTAAQRADVRARIAQRLAQGPSLLVLDNCEHLVREVAELVAFLVSTTADLRVLTTSRAPLAIAAEQVYLLGVLTTPDAVELFRQRAQAARPGARLDEVGVMRIVERLDGLPLAIELAAARIRAMTVEEIDHRLADRFALLRGDDRSAEDRHRTLLAVIDWSWNLLGAAEQRALRRLARFPDGFAIAAADAVLGGGALDAVQRLVDQSLLQVEESAAGLRYRMLETVREFGRLRLREAGDEAEARAAQRAWTVAYACRHGDRLLGRQQLAAIDALAIEESTLADELRDAIDDGDAATLVQLLAALGTFWSIRGDHARMLALGATVADRLRAWRPPAGLENVTRAALAITLMNMRIVADEEIEPLRQLLDELGPGTDDRRLAAFTEVALAFVPGDEERFANRLYELADDPNRHVAGIALQWLGHLHENQGDPDRALSALERALDRVDPDDGPWSTAILRAQLAQLGMAGGDRRRAVEHARAAVPVLRRLGAVDDEIQLRTLLAVAAIADGQPDDAAAILDEIAATPAAETALPMGASRVAHAELALARGEIESGLRAYRDAAAHMMQMRIPGFDETGVEPWSLFGTATALNAHAWFEMEDDEPEGIALFRRCRDGAARILDDGASFLDYPVAGMVLFALGSWSLLRDVAPADDDALRLLLLAERFAYNRTIPSMSWERIAAQAEERLPGHLAELRAELGERRGPELRSVARELVARVGS